MTSAQVLLTFFDMSARTHYLNARQTLTTLLEWRVLPVINENDTTATDEISFGDNDFLAAQVAVLVGADELILLTDIDGLYTRRPAPAPRRAARRGGERLRRAAGARDRPHDLAAGIGRDALEGRRRRDGDRRRDRARDLQRPATRTRCAAVLAGEREGTRFAAREARYSSFKLWLKYAKPARGTLAIDAGAARARARGEREPAAGRRSSRCDGEFDAGDAVEIAVRGHGAAARGAALGKGICNYSAPELRQVMGLKSAAVREILPRATDEAVHRDYLVSTDAPPQRAFFGGQCAASGW